MLGLNSAKIYELCNCDVFAVKMRSSCKILIVVDIVNILYYTLTFYYWAYLKLYQKLYVSLLIQHATLHIHCAHKRTSVSLSE